MITDYCCLNLAARECSELSYLIITRFWRLPAQFPAIMGLCSRTSDLVELQIKLQKALPSPQCGRLCHRSDGETPILVTVKTSSTVNVVDLFNPSKRTEVTFDEDVLDNVCVGLNWTHRDTIVTFAPWFGALHSSLKDANLVSTTSTSCCAVGTSTGIGSRPPLCNSMFIFILEAGRFSSHPCLGH